MSNELRPSQTRLPMKAVDRRKHLQRLVNHYGIEQVAAKMNWTVAQVEEVLNDSISGDIHDKSDEGRSDLPNQDSSVQ